MTILSLPKYRFMALRIGVFKQHQPLFQLAITDAKMVDLPAGKNNWQAVENALLFEQVDAAILPLELIPHARSENVAITTLLERHSPADLLLVKKTSAAVGRILKIPVNGKVAVSSRVAAALLREVRPDLHFQIVENEEFMADFSRLATENDALILPVWQTEIGWFEAENFEKIPLNPREFPPVPGQGAVAVLARKTDTITRLVFKNFHQNEVSVCTNVERQIGKIAADAGAVAGAFCEQDSDGNFHCRAVAILKNGELKQARFSSRLSQKIAETICRELGFAPLKI